MSKSPGCQEWKKNNNAADELNRLISAWNRNFFFSMKRKAAAKAFCILCCVHGVIINWSAIKFTGELMFFFGVLFGTASFRVIKLCIIIKPFVNTKLKTNSITSFIYAYLFKFKLIYSYANYFMVIWVPNLLYLVLSKFCKYLVWILIH